MKKSYVDIYELFELFFILSCMYSSTIITANETVALNTYNIQWQNTKSSDQYNTSSAQNTHKDKIAMWMFHVSRHWSCSVTQSLQQSITSNSKVQNMLMNSDCAKYKTSSKCTCWPSHISAFYPYQRRRIQSANQ